MLSMVPSSVVYPARSVAVWLRLVIVGHPSATPFLQWQPRLSTVQRLNRALLAGAQNDGVFRRIEIQTYDGFQSLGE